MCPICGKNKKKHFLNANLYEISKCLTCGHGYLGNLPTADELDNLYSEADDDFLGNGMATQMAEYFDNNTNKLISYYSDKIKALSSCNFSEDIKILDYGCANGAFLQALKHCGYQDVEGFDINSELIKDGISRWGLELYEGDGDSFLCNQKLKYDVIFSTNVLEHIPDPIKLLKLFSSSLKPNGILLLSIPNTASLQVYISGNKSPIIDPPHHLQYFSPNSLSLAHNNAGLQVLSVSTSFWDAGSDTYLNMKGIPLWLCKLLRHMMFLPKIIIKRLGIGGVINIKACIIKP